MSLIEVDRTALAEVVAGLSEVQRRALDELGDERGLGPTNLSKYLQISAAEARSILHHFVKEGICVFGILWDEDEGTPAGSGYWLENFGCAVKMAALQASGGEK